jgi:glucose-6-phosphate isomerase
MTQRTRLPAWQALDAHAATIAPLHLRELFAADPQRFAALSLRLGDWLLDFSKQRLTPQTLTHLRALADACAWREWRTRMQAGEAINHTEGRAVSHMALRAGTDAPAEVQSSLARMADFCERIHDGNWRGHTGERITDVVNLGIGGSDLGPRMATQALAAFQQADLRVHFVANLDGADLAGTLSRLNPRSTLFIVASKSFSTLETLRNAHSARDWLLAALHDTSAVSRHFVATSSNLAAAAQFGIPEENVLAFADSVGGRFSLWSPVGLSLALAIGFKHFTQFLAGAQAMDTHFFDAPDDENLPLTLALIAVWNTNFLGATSRGVFPYSHSLALLPDYLQQLEMESNGKSVDRDGQMLDYASAPIVWGSAGSNCQHSFFQLLHQGRMRLSCDFIALARADFPLPEHHDGLLANCLAQSAALAFGQSAAEARSAGIGAALIPYRTFPGNVASTTLILPELSPCTLGQLLALYEHKTFCLGVLWNLNSFDQWGVELGKQLAGQLAPALRGAPVAGLDTSTQGLIAHLRHMQR